MTELIRTNYQVVVPFVAAKDQRFSQYSNMGLLDEIAGQEYFDDKLLAKVIKNPWLLESIYKQGQTAILTPDKQYVLHGWVWPGQEEEAAFGVAILSGRMKLEETPDEGVFPAAVYIPEHFFGGEFTADIGGEEAEFVIRGIGIGASCSCCKNSKGAVNFHVVAMDPSGQIRNQSRPSLPGVNKGVGNLFSRDNLIWVAGPDTVHMLNHQFREITGQDPHCHQHLGFDIDSLNAGSKAVPALTR